MSHKHYFSETAVNTLVPRALRALVAANTSLALIEDQRVVLNTNHNPSKVSLISGGGSGHEPSWSGYVGDGCLSAVACGDIFASPSMKQVLTAIASAPSEQGHILLITNYTGDRFHFGLAAERAVAGGLAKKCVVLPATDDVSIGRSKSTKVGRRGLAGNSITMKVLGAAADKGYSWEQCVNIGKAVNEQLVSIGSALDHCHVPGRQNHETIDNDVCVVGAGIHNEPGAAKMSPFPSVEELVSHLLKMLCDQDDKERAFVKFNKNDDIVLFVNNYGGISNLELGALTDEILSQLEKTWSIKPARIYVGAFETSLNGPGFCMTLWNATLAASSCKASATDLLDLLGADTKAPYWPNVHSSNSTKTARKPIPALDIAMKEEISTENDIKVDPELLDCTIRKACQRVIMAEPDITNWDVIMGDGDCGDAVKGVSEATLKILDSGSAKSGSIFVVLYAIIDTVDDMGGTLGAIFGILLAALANALRTEKKKNASSVDFMSIFAPALTQAVESLKNHTGARVGDRTVMDVLIPFQETLESSRNLESAVNAAQKSAEGTRELKGGFGRASYVGEAKGDEQKVPDPGAWAVYEMVMGIAEGTR